MSENNHNTVVVDVKSIVNTCYHISDGNKKLVPNKETAFLIWNIPAVTTCPFKTSMCKQSCYAVKAEKAYKQVLPSRKDNLKMSLLPTFVTDMTEIIRDRAKKTRKPRLIVRIHESGDFYNQIYANKWLEIMRNCEDVEKITFIAYTKSFQFFDGVELPKNFHLRASVWADTDAEQLEIIKRNNWNIYTAVEKFTDHDDFHQCRCQDCATCGKCWSDEPIICCEIH